MVILAHPTGNANVREALLALEEAGLLAEFHTTIAACGENFFAKLARLPGCGEIRRRQFSEKIENKLHLHPLREVGRLLGSKLGLGLPIKHESGFFSLDAVYRSFDKSISRRVKTGKFSAVYSYEDGALETFRAAKARGLACIYDLPIAYWSTVRRLLLEEADRLPEWACTLDGLKDSREKLSRKEGELELADLVFCPSQFVYDSIPVDLRLNKKIQVARFGSPAFSISTQKNCAAGPIRVLFAGSMTQRKGLGDLFAAFRMLDSKKFELHVLGTPVAGMDFYRSHFSKFTHHSTRANSAVLELMGRCDVLVLPSIVEGRALVQQEAMACGLPVIATRNAGAEDLLEDGTAGFLVPIRSPELIAKKLELLEGNRDLLHSMSCAARVKAESMGWDFYRSKIVESVVTELGDPK